ncbi:Protein N-acetyltransferase, RimJ/RimL family [Amycolatopsis xylanica]|uniref:Protein N-acetyltransferase, RimJ/RimL family n=1 Tax=Amycolatopsis xylanica TaxID=589385 RepID=A0A1H3JI20_9PSEU|nr:GNAT family N-acetyltransferase [Amycolatopsis xylanica]SDY39650.1 Protein N-acetyltransferase, RimJ/RimL family [Amycolatopsis xylanica]
MERPAETLPGPDFELRRWRASDAGLVHSAVNSSLSHLEPWVGWVANGYSMADGTEFVTRARETWEAGKTFDYKILVGGELAGACGLMTRRGHGGLEIGYWLTPGHTGRGLMTRVSAVLVDEAFRVGATRVEIMHDEKNVRSGAIPRRLGFTEVERHEADEPGGWACNGVHIVWRLTNPGGPAAP